MTQFYGILFPNLILMFLSIALIKTLYSNNLIDKSKIEIPEILISSEIEKMKSDIEELKKIIKKLGSK